jgi:hypothetical protein
MLSSFLGVLPILIPPLCALAFIMCSKSNLLVVFALDLMSAYEGEHEAHFLEGRSEQHTSEPPHQHLPQWCLISSTKELSPGTEAIQSLGRKQH